MKQRFATTSSACLDYILLSVIVLLPFSTPIIVAASEHLNIFVISGWKEALLLLATPFTVMILMQSKTLREILFTQPTTILIAALSGVYVLWAIVSWSGVETAASFAAGTRFFYAYLLAFVAGYANPRLWSFMLKLICYVAIVVAGFGLLQALILPKDLLTHIGYDIPGTDTQGIPPAYHLVAGDENYVRSQSTLRGPNVLGAYLILPITATVFYLLKKKQIPYFIGGLTCGLALLFSFSRSAWIGTLFAILFLVAIRIPKNKISKYVKMHHVILMFISVLVAVLFLSKTAVFQTAVFHSSQGEKSVSNEGHKDALIQGFRDVIDHPLGNGVGSAGPASVLQGSSRISENYFIQVGQELGWLGLILFVAVCYTLIRFFYTHRAHNAAVILLCSFIGLNITALLLHTWADEAVAITWWVMAGVGTGVILNEKRKHDVQTEEKRNQRSKTDH